MVTSIVTLYSHTEALVLSPGGGHLPEHVLLGLHAWGAAVTSEVAGAHIHPGGLDQGAEEQEDGEPHHHH